MCYCAGLLTSGKTGSTQQEVVQATSLATSLRNDRVSPLMSGEQKEADLPTAAEINGPSLIVCRCEKTPTVQDLQESAIEILFGIPLSEAIMMMVLMSNTRAIMY